MLKTSHIYLRLSCASDHFLCDGFFSSGAHLLSILEESKFTVKSSFLEEFTNNGKTFIFVLSESHCVVHTWPEQCLVEVDLVACCSDFEERIDNFSEILLNLTQGCVILKSYNIRGDNENSLR